MNKRTLARAAHVARRFQFAASCSLQSGDLTSVLREGQELANLLADLGVAPRETGGVSSLG